MPDSPVKPRRCHVEPSDGRQTATAVFRVLRRAIKEKSLHVRAVEFNDRPLIMTAESSGWPANGLAPCNPCVAWIDDKVSLLDIGQVKTALGVFASEADEVAAQRLADITLGRHLYAAGLVVAGKASSYTPENGHKSLTYERTFPAVGRRKVWLVPTQKLIDRLTGHRVKPSPPVGPAMPLWDRKAELPPVPPPCPEPAPTDFDAAMADVCKHLEAVRLGLELVPRPGKPAAPTTALGWARAAVLDRGRPKWSVIREMQQALTLLMDELNAPTETAGV